MPTVVVGEVVWYVKSFDPIGPDNPPTAMIVTKVGDSSICGALVIPGSAAVRHCDGVAHFRDPRRRGSPTARLRTIELGLWLSIGDYDQ